MKTTKILGRLAVVGLVAVLLLAACGSNAIDVTPAKEEEPAVSEPVDEPPREATPAEEPAEPSEPAKQQGEAAPSDPRVDPASVNGWERISPTGDFSDVATSGAGVNILAAGAGAGFLSTDGGATWAALDWPDDVRSGVALDPIGLTIVVEGFSPQAGFETTALISTDGGSTWRDTELEAAAVSSFVLDSFLYGVPGTGIVASNDGGLRSTVIGSVDQAWPPNFDPFSIHVNPRNFDQFAVVSLSEGGNAAVRITLDGGDTFQPLAADFDLWGVTVPVFSSIGPMIMSQGVGVLFSFDRGFTWSEQTQGLESLLSEDRFFYQALIDLVFVPDRGIPVTATEDTVYWFNPGGWRPLPGPGGTIRALAMSNSDPPALLAATDTGIWSIATTAVGG